MTTPAAAAAVRAWTVRAIVIVAGVAVALLLAAGPAHADSPLGLDKIVDSTTSAVQKAASKPKAALERKAAPDKKANATKAVRTVTKPVRQAQKQIRQTTKPVHKITKPVRQAAKPVGKSVIQHRDRAAEPTSKAAQRRSDTAKHSAGKATKKAAAPGSTVKSATSSVLATERQAVGTARHLLAGSVAADLTDRVVAPVLRVHDATIPIVDATLTGTVPSVVDNVTAPLVPVLDDIGAVLPPGSVLPDLPAAPVDLGPGVLVGVPAADGLLPSEVVVSGRTQQGVDHSGTLTIGSDLLTGVLTATTHAPAAVAAAVPTSAAAIGGSSLGSVADAVHDVLSGAYPAGSATAISSVLSLLALASAGAFGVGMARSAGVVATCDGRPMRRALRPAFSPD